MIIKFCGITKEKFKKNLDEDIPIQLMWMKDRKLTLY